MTRTFRVRRRDAVLGLTLLASGLYWLAVWAWVQASFAGVDAHGTQAVLATLHANAITLQATWAWVIGLGGLLTAAGLVAWRRGDREALAGVAWSAALHAAVMLGTGVIGPLG